MKQFIIENAPGKDGVIRLKDGDYRYLARVRRLAVGEVFPARLPDGEQTLVQVVSIENGVLTGKCIAEKTAGKREDNFPAIILFQALPKSGKMDLIARQAAEGGITEIVPFISEFSVAKAGGEKLPRWRRIIKEARQQSGSATETSICQPMKITEVFKYWEEQKKSAGGALGLLFHHVSLSETNKGLEQKSLHSYLISSPRIVALAVGPEGGFSGKEVELFLENGFKPFTIGNTVLRTETAALYCAAAVRILLLERDSWELKQKKADRA